MPLKASTRRWLIFATLVSTCLLVIAAVGVEYLYRTRVQPTLDENVAVQRKHKALYLEDIEFVSRFELLKTVKSGSKDAGPTLNAKLYWTPATLIQLPAGQGVTATLSAPLVSTELRERLLRYRNDWITQYPKFGKMKADLSLFDGIERFDYWDLEVASPIADLIAARHFLPPPSLPLPDTQDLLALAKLRLMKGARDGEQVAALKSVRQLALLLLTTEYMQQTLAGLAILDIERRAYRFYVDDQGLAPDAWTPVDRNLTRRAQRAMLATRGYLHLWTPADLFDEVFFGARPPFGLCAAANEDFPAELALKPLIATRWPFERDNSNGVARLTKLWKLSTASCRLRYLHAMAETGEFNTELPIPRAVSWIPLARQMFGMRLSAVNFSGFETYNALDVKPK